MILTGSNPCSLSWVSCHDIATCVSVKVTTCLCKIWLSEDRTCETFGCLSSYTAAISSETCDSVSEFCQSVV